MALTRPQERLLELTELTGLDLDRGVLVRPIESFSRLENFDVSTPGSIRKTGGISEFSSPTLGSGSVIAGIFDHRNYGTGAYIQAIISSVGRFVNITGGLESFLVQDHNAEQLDPFMVEWVWEGTAFVDPINHTVYTRGPNQRPAVFYYDTGTASYKTRDLGVSNPEDDYDSSKNYHHALVSVYHFASPDPGKGVYLGSGGRRYTWTWYDSVRKHDSSPAPYHLGDANDIYPITAVPGMNIPADIDAGGVIFPIRKPGSFSIIQPSELYPYVTEIQLSINEGSTWGDNAAVEQPSYGKTGPGDAIYDKIRIWATKDGGDELFLVPKLYDTVGNLLSDNEGAIAVSDVSVDPGFPGAMFDGITATLSNDWVLDGIHLAGNTSITVKQSGGITGSEGTARPVPLFDRFTVGDNATVYTLDQLTTPTKWELRGDDELQVPIQFEDETEIHPLVIPVTPREALLIPYLDSTEEQFGQHNPPPKSSNGAVYQNRLWLVDDDDPNRLWFSLIGDFRNFPSENWFDFISDDEDEITALIIGREQGELIDGIQTRLIVAKAQSSFQIGGTSFADFQIAPLLPGVGLVGKHAATVVSGRVVGLTRRGLEIFDDVRPLYFGRQVEVLVDTIVRADQLTMPKMIHSRDRGLGLLMYKDSDATAYNNNILLYSTDPKNLLKDKSPFSRITGLVDAEGDPVEMLTMKESGQGDNVNILVAGDDNIIYKLFSQVEPVESIAETQELPDQNREKWKYFDHLRVEGNEDLSEWTVTFTVKTDTGTFVIGPVELKRKTLIGTSGYTVKVKFVHNKAIVTSYYDGGDTVYLHNIALSYTIAGESRDA